MHKALNNRESDLDVEDILSLPGDSPANEWDTLSTTSSDSSLVDIALPASSRRNDTQSISDEIPEPQVEADAPRRSVRIRNQPDRLNAVSYDPDRPFHSESVTVPNWWPNYPRGSWNPDPNNDN